MQYVLYGSGVDNLVLQLHATQSAPLDYVCAYIYILLDMYLTITCVRLYSVI